ncbi:hypothetical protein [Candidatus Phytoplasma pruni]|uniref:Peptidase M41 domain-containing protein n=1 Tax=Candidatus Phytoplasma pruni TaxID=479893 RepID=A0A851HCX7_9MOLU|nr:hypothetical protein [Candidatus Phytoplasma pruni]NWN45925.1 hypothetical protein [Candidatus Phytoplasma pruni]
MEKTRDIKLENTRAFFLVLPYLLYWFAHYKENYWFINLQHLQLFEEYQAKLKKLIQEKGPYSKQDFEYLKQNTKNYYERTKIQKVIQSCEDFTVEELLTPLVVNLNDVDIKDYLTSEKPIDKEVQDMIRYAKTLSITSNEYDKYQKQGFFDQNDFKIFKTYQKKLQQITKKQGFLSKKDFQNLEKTLQNVNLKKDIFSHYIIKVIADVIRKWDDFDIETLIIPIEKPFTHYEKTLYHETGHAIIALFAQYLNLKYIRVYPNGGGYCEFVYPFEGRLTTKQKIEKIKEKMVFDYGGLVAEEWLQKQYHQIKPQASSGDLKFLREGALKLLYYQEYKKIKENIKTKDFKIRSWKQLTKEQTGYIEQVEKEAYQTAVEIIKEKAFLMPLIHDIYINNNKPFLTKEELLKGLEKHNINI